MKLYLDANERTFVALLGGYSEHFLFPVAPDCTGRRTRSHTNHKLTVKCASSMFCWSASFYPQPILNWRRQSTHGLAIDFPTTNVLGFICYAIYTSAFLYSPLIRGQYAARHPVSPEPSVRLNDFAFAVHAVVLSVTTYSQFFPSIWGFKVSRFQRVSLPVAGIFCGCVCAVVGVTVFVASKGGDDPFGWAWIDVVRAQLPPFFRPTPDFFGMWRIALSRSNAGR